MLADKAKKPKLAETVQDVDSDPVDGELVLSIEKLQEVQDELEKVNEEASDKVLELEKKYNEIRKPVYDRRSEIIKTIPDFWLTAFVSHPALCDLLTEEDQKIVKYLDSLDVEDLKDVKLGYSITFNFKENPYFEDSKLTKAFTFFDDVTTKITGTTIKWKAWVLLMEYIKRQKETNVPLFVRAFSVGSVKHSRRICQSLVMRLRR